MSSSTGIDGGGLSSFIGMRLVSYLGGAEMGPSVCPGRGLGQNKMVHRPARHNADATRVLTIILDAARGFRVCAALGHRRGAAGNTAKPAGSPAAISGSFS